MRFDLDLEDMIKDMDFRECELQNLQNCGFCGTELRFKHKVNVKEKSVMEVSYCPECGMSGKRSDFHLQ